jgi:hypothetical protein
MGEAVVIVIIIILLIVFGFIFYSKWASVSLKAKASSYREMDAYAVASVIANLPELHCSQANVVELNCYDTLKIKAMTRLINDSRQGNFGVSKESYLYYASLFKNAKIVVYEVYPLAPDESASNVSDAPFHYVVYDNEPAKVVQKIPARIPVVLYDPLKEERRFGVIEVVRYY